jgi:hypothetical protein
MGVLPIPIPRIMFSWCIVFLLVLTFKDREGKPDDVSLELPVELANGGGLRANLDVDLLLWCSEAAESLFKPA